LDRIITDEIAFYVTNIDLAKDIEVEITIELVNDISAKI